MDTRLYEAAINGDATDLHDLLQQDGHFLGGNASDPIAKYENPLHVAALFGQTDFAKEVSSQKPDYACEFNWQEMSPLHHASEKGHVKVVKLLPEKDSGFWLVRYKRGRIPLHIAASKGRVEVLKELFHAKPMAVWILTDRGEPILHVCANNNQFQALKTLIKLVENDAFVNMKDNGDNSILH